MVEEKKFLVKKLKEAGLKGTVFESLKKMKLSNEMQFAGVFPAGDTLVRSGSKIKFVDEEGRRSSRHKLWARDTKLRVVIAGTSDEKVDEILVSFLRVVGKGLVIDGNWVDMELGELDWVDEDDSILKAKMAVQFDVTFKSGIYHQDYLLRQAGVEIKVEV